MHQSIAFHDPTTLLNRARNGGKYGTCTDADKLNGAYSNGQYHRQHDGVFGDVLSGVSLPQSTRDPHRFILGIRRKLGGGGAAQGAAIPDALGLARKRAIL